MLLASVGLGSRPAEMQDKKEPPEEARRVYQRRRGC